MKIRASLQVGLIAGTISIFLVLLGLTRLAGQLVQGWFKTETASPGAVIALLLVAFWAGGRAYRLALGKEEAHDFVTALLAGGISGLVHGVLLGPAVTLISTLIEGGVKLRSSLAQLTDPAVALLTMGRTPVVAGLVLLGGVVAVSLGAALVNFSNGRFHWWDAIRKGLRGGWTSAATRGAGITQNQYMR
ncbi:MAG: hypothetical protein ACP5JJ_16785, partial [Anaerolineae bacterium]